MEFAELVRKRRIVRHFKHDPVEMTAIDRILDLARRIPSAGFSQGQDFIVVTDPEQRRAVARLCGEAEHYALWLAAALSCIVGHIFPVYLRFRGGKGVATGLGATLGIFPETALPCAISLALWLAVTGSSGYVSAGSMVAALSLPVSTLLTLHPLDVSRHWPLLLYTAVLAALVVYRHRTNLARLRAGTEPRIGRRQTE